MFRLTVFRHCPGTQLLHSPGSWLPNSGNVMAWSGSSARFRDYGISPTDDIGCDFLTLRSLGLLRPSGLSKCQRAEQLPRRHQAQNHQTIYKFEVEFHRIPPDVTLRV